MEIMNLLLHLHHSFIHSWFYFVALALHSKKYYTIFILDRFLLVCSLSFYPFVYLKRDSFVIFNVWSPIILPLLYTALTSKNLRTVHPSAGWQHVFAFMFFLSTFFEVAATEGIPLIPGNNWAAVYFNERAPSAEQEQLNQSELPRRLPTVHMKGCRGPWSLETDNESLKNPDGTSRFLKPWIIT